MCLILVLGRPGSIVYCYWFICLRARLFSGLFSLLRLLLEFSLIAWSLVLGHEWCRRATRVVDLTMRRYRFRPVRRRVMIIGRLGLLSFVYMLNLLMDIWLWRWAFVGMRLRLRFV